MPQSSQAHFENYAQEGFQGASNHSTTPNMKGLKEPYIWVISLDIDAE